jgi:thiopurine S-methyltransferase
MPFIVMNDFWKSRWLNGDTPWHQTEVEVLLKKFCPNRALKKSLVPLCGKSLDLGWLKQRSEAVVGVELSSIACEEFFRDLGAAAAKTEHANFVSYSGGGITLLCGDFFAIPMSEFQGVDFVYDRAALIALPEDLRKRYAARITEMMRSCAAPDVEMILIGREDGSHGEGPPFEVTEQEVRNLYGSALSVTVVGSAQRPSRADPDRILKETAYRIQR